jgi:TPR repeat protein
MREAAAGDREAQWNVGRMAYAGFGTPRDDALARRSFTVAAERGHVGAAAMAGYLSYHGKGGIADPLGGRALLKKAADGGDRWGQGQYGLVVFAEANASGISDDLRPAAAMLEEAAEAGELAAQLMLGTTVYRSGIGNVARDNAKMLKYLRMAADTGDGMALFELGRLHLGGHPAVPVDLAAGWALIRKAVAAGWAPAQHMLGMASIRGSNGLAKDEAEGLKQLRAAVAAGDREAKADYALVLDKGLIVPRDLPGAVRLSREAALAGSPDGRVIYAKYLYLGEGVAKDVAEAARLARLAAEQGNAEGQLLWGTLLWEGAGVPADRPAAVRWFRKAAANRNPQAIEKLKDADVAKVAAAVRQ